ncbi:SRPBCC family protein [Mycobacterium spongiae]|nr:SRPBCC family protein [Mycobacterium spongiae]
MMPTSTTNTRREPPLNQIAISVRDVQHSQRWYRDIFGYQESGGTYAFIPSLGSADVQGVPDATSVCWWLMDQQDFFQIELFQFSKPTPEPVPADWRPCDIGYSMVGIHVTDFDATLERLARRRVDLLSEPIGPAGMRRVCVRDPDGVLLEIMEDDPRAADQRARPHHVPVATRFVTVSVPDLEQARHTWIEVLGLPEEHDVVLHTPEHERLWGLAGSARESFLLRAHDIFIEVVHYSEPRGKPWPRSYQISDYGLLNVALGFRSLPEQETMVSRCIEANIRPNSTKPTLLKKLWYACYVNDPMGFSIELLYHAKAGVKRRVNPANLLELGFVPRQAPVIRSQAEALSAAPPQQVWDVLVDHENMASWSRYARSEVLSRAVDGEEAGTVRKLSGGPLGLGVTETIVAAERAYRLEYTAVGAPGIRFFHGFVTLEPTMGAGTKITWEAQFCSAMPAAGKATSSMLKELARGLAAEAEKPPIAI